jgi:MSHA biogenesis protein MshJ
MTGWLRRLELRLDRLSVRERVLVLGACLGVVFVLVDTVALRPLTHAAALAAEARASVADQSESLEARARELEAALAADPHRGTREEVVRLEAEAAALDARLGGRTADLVSPDRMAALLEDLLASSPAGRVTHLEALAPEPLFTPEPPVDGPGRGAATPGTAATTAGVAAARGGFFRHGMRVELRATFQETLAFLRVLESLPAGLLFGRLTYEVEQYPRARVVLEVYTLGAREGWLGV